MNLSARREKAFQLLYSLEVQKEIEEDTLTNFFENNEVEDEKVKRYIQEIANGIKENKQQIDEQIMKNLKEDWKIERISKINLSLLRLAIYEIQYKQVPFKVVINEVVELAKKYAEDQSPAFINGILANIVKKD